MRHPRVIIPLLLIILTSYAFFHSNLREERERFLENAFVDYTLPSELTGPMALEFKGITSDFLLFKFMSFFGNRMERKKGFDERSWAYIIDTLHTITDLDPYFWDAYLYSQMFLTWEAGKYREANEFLQKAGKYRPNDYRIPYYIGFNHYYHLNDSANGAKYIMEASKLPGAPYYLASLGARLATYSFQHRIAVTFLMEMLQDTTNPRALKEFPLRIETLKIMDTLEHRVDAYRKKHGRLPAALSDLVASGLIAAIPDDPYGGEFVLLENGRVYTTSNMLIQNTAK